MDRAVAVQFPQLEHRENEVIDKLKSEMAKKAEQTHQMARDSIIGEQKRLLGIFRNETVDMFENETTNMKSRVITGQQRVLDTLSLKVVNQTVAESLPISARLSSDMNKAGLESLTRLQKDGEDHMVNMLKTIKQHFAADQAFMKTELEKRRNDQVRE